MPIQNNNISLTNPVVLFAPLDWGLGHTTRCIPLIRYLLSLDCQIVAAVNKSQQAILEQEFTNIRFTFLAGYQLSYGSSGWRTITKIIVQIPKIITAVRRENKWLRKFIFTNHVDAVVSDNRFGLFNKQLHCVFITHQLTIKSPFGNAFQQLLQIINYRFINKFNACWVPDYKENANLAGKLSHPEKLPAVPVAYLGRISRLTDQMPSGIKGELLIVLSGPEPQRGIFEKILIKELKGFRHPVVLVRGLPKEENDLHSGNKNVVVYNYLPSERLAAQIATAEIIISRSGYSTVMDLIGRGKKCIFIPTPGQPEQIYLADYLQEQKRCIRFHQHSFSLEKALQQAENFPFATGSGLPAETYKKVLQEFVAELKRRKR